MNDLERLCRIMGTFDLATGHAETMSDALDALEEELRDVLGHLRGRREWVGLQEFESVDLAYDFVMYDTGCNEPWFDRQGFAEAVEAKLKERNT